MATPTRSPRASRAVLAAALAISIIATGCGDPGDGSTDADAAPDTVADTVGDSELEIGEEPDGGEEPDTDPDGADDVAPDTMPDVRPDAESDAVADTESDALADTELDGPPQDADADTALPACIETGCPDGFQCYSTGCLPVIAAGDACSQPDDNRCEQGAFCAETDDGERCVPYGAHYSRCRGGGSRPEYECRQSRHCDDGLFCDTSGFSLGRCLPGIEEGEFCGGASGSCNAEDSCSDMRGTDICTADGALGGRCRPNLDDLEVAPTLCDGDLTCVRSGDDCVRGSDRCAIVVGVGEACGSAGQVCSDGLQCIAGPFGTQCEAAGAPGTLCGDDSPACADGTECLLGESGDERCRRRVEGVEQCDGAGLRTLCPVGMACSATHASDPGVCAAPGTTAGADCREEAPECDGELSCSDFARYRRSCGSSSETGERCALSGSGVVCAEGDRCLPVMSHSDGLMTAVCMPRVPESEPNGRDLVFDRDGVPSALYSGVMPGDDEEDCFVTTLDSVGSLFIEVVSSAPTVTASLFDPAQVEIGRWTLYPHRSFGPLAGSARLEPSAVPLLREMPAGNYVVCVRDVGTDASYALGISSLSAPR